ncbi:MAG: hypothetical protein FWG02_04810, partial [Holophagaceae bacterium]|nr:hypothetical protein [Holophagaceae bacterium]
PRISQLIRVLLFLPAIVAVALHGQVAQDPVMTASQKLLDGYLNNAKLSNGAFFFYDVLDGKIAPAMVKIRNDSPEVYDRILYLYGSRADWVDRSHMPASARKNGWQIEPRWWIVDKDGTTIFSSTEVPTEEEVIKQLDNAEIPSISQILKDYVRKNPDRDGALMRLLNHQYEVAFRKLLKYHLIDNGWNQGYLFGIPEPELKRPLTPTEDTEIWGDFAATLRLATDSEAWTQSNRSFPLIANLLGGIWMPGKFMVLSPTVKTLASQLLPRVTQVVKELPESVLAWKLWLVLERASGNMELFQPLLASIEERPFAPIDYPYWRVLDRYREFLPPMYGSEDPVLEQYLLRQFEASIKDPIDSLGKQMEARRKSQAWRPALDLINIYTVRKQDINAEQILLKFIEWTAGNCKAERDYAVEMSLWKVERGVVGSENLANVAKRWSEIDLESYKNLAKDKPDTSSITWLVLDNDTSDISAAFSELINSYSLDSLPAPVKIEKLKNAPQFAYLNLKPGWGLYDGKNHVFAYSDELPTHDLILHMARQNRVLSKIREYESFKRGNSRNAHLEIDLLTEYLKLADKRMERLNKAQPDKQSLTEEEDNIIWRPIATILSELLSNGRYKLENFRIQIPESVVQSPIMKTLATRLINPLGELIKSDPYCSVNYSLWFSLNELLENRHSLIGILSSLTPIPGDGSIFDRSTDLSIVKAIGSEAVERREWDFITKNFNPIWNYWLNQWREGQTKPNDGLILGLLAPLIEASLASNDVVQADKVFSEFMDSTIFSRELQAEIVELATKRNKPEVAKKWEAMRPSR